MLPWFRRRRVRTPTGTALLVLVASLWVAMAAQPCLADQDAMARQHAVALAAAMPNCHDPAPVFPCNDFANLDCELPERGPFASAQSLPFVAPALIHTLDIALILAPAGARHVTPATPLCPAAAAAPPLNIQHCVFLI